MNELGISEAINMICKDYFQRISESEKIKYLNFAIISAEKKEKKQEKKVVGISFGHSGEMVEWVK